MRNAIDDKFIYEKCNPKEGIDIDCLYLLNRSLMDVQSLVIYILKLYSHCIPLLAE